MMRRVFIPLLISMSLATPLWAAEPADSIAAARQRVMNRDYEAALRLLKSAAPAADSITALSERVAAVSAIHFLSAVALTELGRVNEATAELRTFFEYRPRVNLERRLYSARFVELFNDTRRDVARADRGTFSEHYPGFELSRPEETTVDALWASSTAFQLLATAAERQQWQSLETNDARRRFVDEFWKRRDSDPSTPANETRDLLLRRIRFADHMFAVGEHRGSMSDRGQVFVLLGAPWRVVVRPLNQLEARFMPRRRGAGNGAVEQWDYRQEQLPAKIPDQETSFRFVSDAGTATRILQRDFYTTAALGAAKSTMRGD